MHYGLVWARIGQAQGRNLEAPMERPRRTCRYAIERTTEIVESTRQRCLDGTSVGFKGSKGLALTEIRWGKHPKNDKQTHPDLYIGSGRLLPNKFSQSLSTRRVAAMTIQIIGTPLYSYCQQPLIHERPFLRLKPLHLDDPVSRTLSLILHAGHVV